MADPRQAARDLGWLVEADEVVVPLGARRHAVRVLPDDDGGWLLQAEVPQDDAHDLAGLVRRNRSTGLAWFAVDEQGRVVVRGSAAGTSPHDDLLAHLREVARLADDHERLLQEEDLL